MATSRAMDFTNVKERGDINPVHKPEGDYRAKVTKVLDIKMGETQRDAWNFVIKVGTGTYPYRCGFTEKELWKIRNIFVACGVSVPKKRVKVNPDLVVGKDLAVTLIDHEYEGRLSSEVAAVFPIGELEGDGTPVDDEDEEDEEEEAMAAAPADEDEEEDEEEEAPKPKSKKKKAKAPVDDDEDLESLDIEDL